MQARPALNAKRLAESECHVMRFGFRDQEGHCTDSMRCGRLAADCNPGNLTESLIQLLYVMLMSSK